MFDLYSRAYCLMFLDSIMLSQKRKNLLVLIYSSSLKRQPSSPPQSYTPHSLLAHPEAVKVEEASMKQTTTTRFSGH